MSGAKVLPLPVRVRRGRDEREFLPAALEIIDTPVSPARRAIALTIVAAAAVAVAWACVGKVDIIASAPGRIVPVGRSKTVQPLEAGVVRAIHVDDGDHVRAGEALIELDPTQPEADQTRFARDLVQAHLDRARLEGLRQAWLTGVAPSLIDPPADATPAQLDAADAAMREQVVEQAAKLAAFDQQIAEKQAESNEATATLAKLQASLPLVAAEVDVRRQLVEMQLGNKLAYLEIQQRYVEQQHELVVVERKREEADAASAALQQQRDQARAEYEKTVLSDLAKAEQQVNDTSQELVKATQKAQLETLCAPIDGTVQQLTVHTVGGVVTPAESVLVIVPDNPGLIVEARVDNKDVGFVHTGQITEIKVEAFNFTRYGLIHGIVVGLSRDAVIDDRTKGSTDPKSKKDEGQLSPPADSSPAYTARLALEQTSIETENGSVPLEPGMAITAEIKTGGRRVISYLLSPLMRYRQEGMTER